MAEYQQHPSLHFRSSLRATQKATRAAEVRP
jgi:hypothetical protein